VTAPAALLWDLDGTLIDSEPVHFLALSEALASLGAAVPPGLQQALLGYAPAQIHAHCVAHLGVTASCEELTTLKLAAYARLAPRLRPRHEALELFLGFRARRLPQAIVSNSDRLVVDINLRGIGLTLSGLVTVSRNDVRRGKPDPEPFLRAAHLLDVAPAACVVVEDSPVGAAAGLAAGMRVIGFPEPGDGPPIAFPAQVEVAGDGAALAVLLARAGLDPHPPRSRPRQVQEA
jgi:HAD superfamily hydrolase (TIGR01509 family)